MNDRQFASAHNTYLTPPDGPESLQSEDIWNILEAAGVADDVIERVVAIVEALAQDWLYEKERECAACAKAAAQQEAQAWDAIF